MRTRRGYTGKIWHQPKGLSWAESIFSVYNLFHTLTANILFLKIVYEYLTVQWSGLGQWSGSLVRHYPWFKVCSPRGSLSTRFPLHKVCSPGNSLSKNVALHEIRWPWGLLSTRFALNEVRSPQGSLSTRFTIQEVCIQIKSLPRMLLQSETRSPGLSGVGYGGLQSATGHSQCEWNLAKCTRLSGVTEKVPRWKSTIWYFSTLVLFFM